MALEALNDSLGMPGLNCLFAIRVHCYGELWAPPLSIQAHPVTPSYTGVTLFRCLVTRLLSIAHMACQMELQCVLWEG